MDRGDERDGAVGMMIDIEVGRPPATVPNSPKGGNPGCAEEMDDGGPLNVAPAVDGEEEGVSSENGALALAMLRTKGS